MSEKWLQKHQVTFSDGVLDNYCSPAWALALQFSVNLQVLTLACLTQERELNYNESSHNNPRIPSFCLFPADRLERNDNWKYNYVGVRIWAPELDPSLGGTVFNKNHNSLTIPRIPSIDPWLSETQAPFYCRKNVARKHYWESLRENREALNLICSFFLS